jgi:hypothetical protein
MAKVVNLGAYRKDRLSRHRPPVPPGAQDDMIVIRRCEDGTYIAQMFGAYASSSLLAMEHASDLASTLARKERLR